MKEFLYYDDIYLIPNFNKYVTSRSTDADASVFFLDKKWRLPIIPANMEAVIDEDTSYKVASQGCFYIFHRFKNKTIPFVKSIQEYDMPVSISIGVKEESKILLSDLKTDNLRVDYITIDVAHAHGRLTMQMVDFIKNIFPKSKLIVGNIATAEAYDYLCLIGGIDAVKVGIGGGSICSTKFKTGFHVPTLTSLIDIKENSKVASYKKLPIIADGGLKHFGDITKALVFGADMVMSGALFADCNDSPAPVGKGGQKIYFGSTSVMAKGDNNHIEGHEVNLDRSNTSYTERLVEIEQSLKSAISYAGGEDLSIFKKKDAIQVGKIHR